MKGTARDVFKSLFNAATVHEVEARPGLFAGELDALNDAAVLGFYLKCWSGVAEFREDTLAADMIELAVLNKSLKDVSKVDGVPPGFDHRLHCIAYREHDPVLGAPPAYYVYDETFVDERRLVTKPYWQVEGPRALQLVMGALLTRLVQRDIKSARHVEGGFAVVSALAQAYECRSDPHAAH